MVGEDAWVEGERKKERKKAESCERSACMHAWKNVFVCVHGEAKNIGEWRRKNEEGNNRRCGACKRECMHGRVCV